MSKWIYIEKGCEMPQHGDRVLISLWIDNSYGKGVDIVHEVDVGVYNQYDGGIPSEYNGSIYTNAGFDTDNDWDYGQPIKVIAWMSLPAPYMHELLPRKLQAPL